MDVMTTAHRESPSRRLTRDDLVELPDDGLRYEVIDGDLLVSPAPRYRHQRLSAMLLHLLMSSCPAGLTVLHAPFAVGLAEDTEVQPDLLVAPRAEFTEVDLPTAPMLVVEILSPSTRHVDLEIKRVHYERAGIASYWIIDPDGPSATVLELVEGCYVETAVVGAGDTWPATHPFPVTIRPGDLID